MGVMYLQGENDGIEECARVFNFFSFEALIEAYLYALTRSEVILSSRTDRETSKACCYGCWITSLG